MALEEGGSYEVWGRVGEDGLLSWAGMYMVMVCGEVFEWVRRHSAKILRLRLGWGIK